MLHSWVFPGQLLSAALLHPYSRSFWTLSLKLASQKLELQDLATAALT